MWLNYEECDEGVIDGIKRKRRCEKIFISYCDTVDTNPSNANPF